MIEELVLLSDEREIIEKEFKAHKKEIFLKGRRLLKKNYPFGREVEREVEKRTEHKFMKFVEREDARFGIVKDWGFYLSDEEFQEGENE